MMMIVVSVVIGLMAVILASRWIVQQAAVATNKVVVAARDLDLGTRLTPEMLKQVEWPSGSIPPGAIQDMNLLVKDEARVIRVSLARGEPVLETKLAPVGTKGGLSAVIKEGRRAITVRVNDVIGVAGFALPGNYVDVVVNTLDDAAKSAGRDKPISKIVLERILVLAVAQEVGRDETKPKVVNAVTLEVTPEQAEKIDLARSVGSLSLVLRNQIDDKAVETTGITKKELLKYAEPPDTTVTRQEPAEKKVVQRRVAREPSRGQIEVIRGVATTKHELRPE
jgi:pilus assembly protein CpaB